MKVSLHHVACKCYQLKRPSVSGWLVNIQKPLENIFPNLLCTCKSLFFTTFINPFIKYTQLDHTHHGLSQPILLTQPILLCAAEWESKPQVLLSFMGYFSSFPSSWTLNTMCVCGWVHTHTQTRNSDVSKLILNITFIFPHAHTVSFIHSICRNKVIYIATQRM